jgi:hypothetical protein
MVVMVAYCFFNSSAVSVVFSIGNAGHESQRWSEVLFRLSTTSSRGRTFRERGRESIQLVCYVAKTVAYISSIIHDKERTHITVWNYRLVQYIYVRTCTPIVRCGIGPKVPFLILMTRAATGIQNGPCGWGLDSSHGPKVKKYSFCPDRCPSLSHLPLSASRRFLSM